MPLYRPPPSRSTWPLAALSAPPVCHSNRLRPISSLCPFHVVHRQLVTPSNMSATSMFPMCVRASRGLLRLRSGAMGVSSPVVVDTVRTLSTDQPPVGTGSATGGLAQAILQERLQQQQQSQVRRLGCVCALVLSTWSAAGDVGRERAASSRTADVKPSPREPSVV